MTSLTPRPDWLVPQWPAPAGVRAIFSTRLGGVSAPPFDSFNLGLHVGDDPAHVTANRHRLQKAMAARPVFLQQVHANQVLYLRGDTAPDGAFDACFTDQTGLACTIMAADCLPLLLCSLDGRWVGAAHVGWRGLAAGVLEQICQRLQAAASGVAAGHVNPIMAWLGPCIGLQRFEVGLEVYQALRPHNLATPYDLAMPVFVPVGQGKYLVNLAALARQRLWHLGIDQIFGNDGSASWCTASRPELFFSHRRDGRSGRMAACIWRCA